MMKMKLKYEKKEIRNRKTVPKGEISSCLIAKQLVPSIQATQMSVSEFPKIMNVRNVQQQKLLKIGI